jgi:hypothetical protein
MSSSQLFHCRVQNAAETDDRAMSTFCSRARLALVSFVSADVVMVFLSQMLVVRPVRAAV